MSIQLPSMCIDLLTNISCFIKFHVLWNYHDHGLEEKMLLTLRLFLKLSLFSNIY